MPKLPAFIKSYLALFTPPSLEEIAINQLVAARADHASARRAIQTATFQLHVSEEAIKAYETWLLTHALNEALPTQPLPTIERRLHDRTTD